jgi:hypothetical protein
LFLISQQLLPPALLCPAQEKIWGTRRRWQGGVGGYCWHFTLCLWPKDDERQASTRRRRLELLLLLVCHSLQHHCFLLWFCCYSLFLSLHPWHNAKNQLHHHVLGGKKKVFKCKQAPEKANPLCIQADKPFREKRISLCVCNSNGMLFSSSPISNSVVHIYWTAVCTRLLYFVKVEYKTCIQVAPPACCLFCRKKRQETRRHGCCNEQKRGKTKSPQERCQERNQKRNQTQRLCVCVCVCGVGGEFSETKETSTSCGDMRKIFSDSNQPTNTWTKTRFLDVKENKKGSEQA